jgi:hypothetical protein
MDLSSSQKEKSPAARRFQWKEYRLLFYSALIGVAGGLGWLLNAMESILLVAIAGYRPHRLVEPLADPRRYDQAS